MWPFFSTHAVYGLRETRSLMNFGYCFNGKTFSQIPRSLPILRNKKKIILHALTLSHSQQFSFSRSRVSRDMFFSNCPDLPFVETDVSPDGGRYGEIVTICPVRGSQHFIERIILE
jgi:hypothetical protein